MPTAMSGILISHYSDKRGERERKSGKEIEGKKERDFYHIVYLPDGLRHGAADSNAGHLDVTVGGHGKGLVEACNLGRNPKIVIVEI